MLFIKTKNSRLEKYLAIWKLEKISLKSTQCFIKKFENLPNWWRSVGPFVKASCLLLVHEEICTFERTMINYTKRRLNNYIMVHFEIIQILYYDNCVRLLPILFSSYFRKLCQFRITERKTRIVLKWNFCNVTFTKIINKKRADKIHYFRKYRGVENGLMCNIEDENL